MKYYPLTQRFTGGEMSPRLYGQANTDRYQESLQEMTNFLALPQGPAMRRQGFGYVADALNNTDVRLLPFKVPGSTDYCVELGPGYISILTRNGRENFTTDELLRNGDFSEGLLNWIEGGTAAIYTTTAKDVKRANFKMESSVLVNTGKVLEQAVITGATIGNVDITFDWGAFAILVTGSNDDFNSFDFVVKVGTAAGLGDLLTKSYGHGDGEIRPVVSGEYRYPDDDIGNTYPAMMYGTDTVTVDIVANDPVYLSFELYNPPDSQGWGPGLGSAYIGTVMGWVGNTSFSGNAVISDTFPTPWVTEADLGLIQYVSESGGGRMYFAHPNYEPQILTLDDGSWLFGPMTLTAPPASWTGTNWPAVVEFFQGRLWLAATTSDPSTIWASKSGNPFDFTIGVNDDDAMELPLSTTGGIKWMKGQKGMVIGTDIGEQLITSQGSLITPTDRKASKQSGWGSVDIQPSLAGNDIVYVSQDRTKVRAINSTFSNASWTSIDLTWVAEHITSKRVIETIYIQNPNYQLWCLLSDGTIVICTYDREHEVVAWQRIVTSGSFLSITKTDSVEGTNMWAGVRRGSLVTIEVIDADESEWKFTDSWTDKPIMFGGVSGLDHLEGRTVQVVVDGAVEPDKVVTGGAITVENTSGNRAVTGLEYIAKMITLPLSQGNKAGTGLIGKQRYSRIVVQLHDSALPLINGIRPPERSPGTPMNTVEPNTSTEADVRNLGRDSGGRVIIEQDLPKKCMVTAIYGKSDQEAT